MVRGQKKELLSQSELQELENQKRELEDALREADNYGDGQINKSSIKGQITKITNAIEAGQPTRVRDKDKLHKEEKELEVALQEGMPSWYEMRQPTKNPGAVRKHMNWCTRNQAKIERYRTIQRLLRPFEPKSVENLRKDK